MNAAVAGVVDELDFEGQTKILRRQVADQKRVVLDAGALADNLSVIDTPERTIAGPAAKIPLLRGPLRLLEALAVVPIARRRLPAARLPFERL